MPDANICYIRPLIPDKNYHLFMTPSFRQEDYSKYWESTIQSRWLRPDVFHEILRLKTSVEQLGFEKLGLSTENRSIYKLRWGKGPIKVLCWTQMHGNEPTASLAVLDLLNFLCASDTYNPLRSSIADKITLVIIPMLNPDGAEYFTRRNAVNIDLNRDAVSKCSVEMQLFLNFVEEFRPDWAFNLHDQRNIFSAGNSDRTATLSYLAASADIERTVTRTRLESMKMIAALAENTINSLGHYVGRYTDEFYPRALGEYFHTHEIPCVLIESGAFAKDYNRNIARKQNFIALLYAFELIGTETYKSKTEQDYKSIPLNHQNLFDLIIRDCTYQVGKNEVKMDLGLLLQELPNTESQALELTYLLSDIGDLSYHHGIEEKREGIISDKQKLEIGKVANFQIKRENKSDLIFIKGKQQ